MIDYEKLGAFYLGRTYDIEKKAIKDDLLLYDSKDLTTHAVCVGMTGSGKTGLCIGLIEEAAIDGIPAILIDPKGDLANLMLTFPELRSEDFLPWINLDDARKKELNPEAYAAKQAETWKKGISGWGQDGSRIQRLRDSADVRIYTPGSSAGIPVSILKSFAAPEASILQDNDLLRERINTMVTSLLGLAGIDADPVQSREHILVSTILDHTWRQNKDLDLATLIQSVQSPPVTKIGILDLESFYPSKERFELVLSLNNILASPGFSAWLEGVPLDIGNILYTPAGKPRIAIFSIAHLSDPERMFFVSLLMNQILGWMRNQSGTTSLRALVYMDEIMGYLPPTQNPPSKTPILTLLKQARAFGVGMMLATQNPIDLDYKALSNAGTWFIGRLQTERDKARLLDGLESANTGDGFDRKQIERIISNLGSRVFLMNNTHEDVPELFHTRWALSYLRGPLTRDQIKTLMDPVKAAEISGKTVGAATKPGTPPTVSQKSAGSQPPSAPPGVSQYYLPTRGLPVAGTELVYMPHLFGAATVSFVSKKDSIDTSKRSFFVTPITDNPIPVKWQDAVEIDIPANDLEKSSVKASQFSELPKAGGNASNYRDWEKDFTTWLYGTQNLELLFSPSLKTISTPGEDERAFRIRLQQSSREQRDEMAEALRKKYASKINTLQERLRKAEQNVEKQEEQAKKAKLDAALSVGSALLSAFTGRKLISRSNVNKAQSTLKGFTRSAEQSKDVELAIDSMEAVRSKLEELQAEFEAELSAVQDKLDPLTEKLETIAVKPRKSDINVELVCLAWAPFWKDANGSLSPAW